MLNTNNLRIEDYCENTALVNTSARTGKETFLNGLIQQAEWDYWWRAASSYKTLIQRVKGAFEKPERYVTEMGVWTVVNAHGVALLFKVVKGEIAEVVVVAGKKIVHSERPESIRSLAENIQAMVWLYGTDDNEDWLQRTKIGGLQGREFDVAIAVDDLEYEKRAMDRVDWQRWTDEEAQEDLCWRDHGFVGPRRDWNKEGELAEVKNIEAWDFRVPGAKESLKKARTYLSFLNGRKGTVSAEARDNMSDLEELLWNLTGESYGVRWDEGFVAWQQNGKDRTMKLGKLLNKLIKKTKDDSAAARALSWWAQKFETREMEFNYEIRTDLMSVLNMSTNQVWRSCTAIDGMNSFCAVNEARSGTAVMYFYRGKAHRPCGRVLIRPICDKGLRPQLQLLRVVYGSGPEVTEIKKELERLVAGLRVTYDAGAITAHSIYDDNQNGYRNGDGPVAEEVMDMVWM